MKVHGYAAESKDQPLKPVLFDRQEPQKGEVAFKVTYCGVCHSDLHQVRDDWGNTIYPCVPGHEVVGVVTSVGEGVNKFKEGDQVGVGCMIDSCQECSACNDDLENFCTGPKSCTLTYNGSKNPDGANTYGGYSTHMCVREEFVLQIPEKLDAKYAGPIMCAGITVYSPMMRYNLKKGQHLGVAGIGGLGHMAVQLGKALGAKVTAFTHSEGNIDRIYELGADNVVVSTREDEMTAAAQSLDLLIDTIPVAHDIAPYLTLMKPRGTVVNVGNMIEFEAFSPGPLVFNGLQFAGSLIGGIKETQEVLDLCAKHDIKPKIKMIEISELNQVFDQMAEGSHSEFRHVIDMESLRELDQVKNDKASKIKDPKQGAI